MGMQVFHRSTNVISRVTIFGGLFAVVGALYLLAAINRSPWATRQGIAREQPVQFSHRHHAGELGIDCRYCHTTVEELAYAGMPTTQTCMSCHAQIWSDSGFLEPVRASLRDEKPIRWVKVYDLPGYVYFDHSVHVAKGIGCSSCHGEVDEMPLMWQESSLQMEWCLSCHRDPKPFIRPRERVFDMDYEMPLPPSEAGRLVEEYDVQSLTNCSICHR